MVPLTVGLGLINFNMVIDSAFASRLIDPELAPTAIDKAFRIYMLPQGVFAVAVVTVLFPSLARLAARRDVDGFRHTVALGLRRITFLLVPATVVLAVLAEPIVRLLYERGRFDAHQTDVVAGALAAFSIGLTFNGTMLMLNRAFFSLQENWVPTSVAFGNLAVNAILDAVFYRFGVWGIPLATSVVNLAGTAVLLTVLRRRLAGMELAETASVASRIVGASVLLAATAYPVWRLLDEALGRTWPAQVATLGAAVLAGGAVYLGACRALGLREVDALLSLRGRLRRA
jgi:putative peptidoglycan lipid II flippase